MPSCYWLSQRRQQRKPRSRLVLRLPQHWTNILSRQPLGRKELLAALCLEELQKQALVHTRQDGTTRGRTESAGSALFLMKPMLFLPSRC